MSSDMGQPIIPVDFGNCDADGAVRLITAGAVEAIAAADLRLHEGVELRLTDGELNAIGTASFRDGMWVAIIVTWLD